MPTKEKLSLRVERLEQQVNKVLSKNEERQKKIEQIKPQDLYDIENNILFKYCKGIHQIYSKYYQIFKKIALKFNPIIFYFIITGCFISTQIIFIVLEKKSPDLWYKIFLYIYLTTITFPIFLAFFQFKIYLEFKQFLFSISKEIFISLQTFIIVYSFEDSVYSIGKVIVYKLVLSNIKNYEMFNLLPKIYMIPSFLIFLILAYVTLISVKILIQGFLQTTDNKWKNYKFSILFLSTIIPFWAYFSLKFWSELPEFNNALIEDLLEMNIINNFEFYKTLFLTPYKFRLLLPAYIFHFIAHLTCKYFVDKQYIEEHNILPLH